MNCSPDFECIPAVVNGASDLFVEVFKENGKHISCSRVGIVFLNGRPALLLVLHHFHWVFQLKLKLLLKSFISFFVKQILKVASFFFRFFRFSSSKTDTISSNLDTIFGCRLATKRTSCGVTVVLFACAEKASKSFANSSTDHESNCRRIPAYFITTSHIHATPYSITLIPVL